MLINIITFHDTFNYGATLQSAALSRYLSSQGHKVIVINYLPYYVRRKKSCLKEFYNVKNRTGVIGKTKALIKAVIYLFHFPQIISRDAKFTDFIHKNLMITKRFKDYKELKDGDLRGDVFICGSDQIWNPNLTGGSFDRSFFLDFIMNNKFAYGVSVGELDVSLKKSELKNLTTGFSEISVREQSTADELCSILERDVDVVLDPTLLLNREDYETMERPIKIHQPYLLYYTVSKSSSAIKTAMEIASDRQLKIIDISPDPFIRIEGAKKVNNIGPGEFLSYIKNADCIVTNSFHGTVFSIIYEKEFYTCPHKTRSARVVDLLNILNISDRLITEEAEHMDIKEIDYTMVSRLLTNERKSSLNYLEKNCENMMKE